MGRWTHKTGETTNCYTGNKWDCADVETCTSECVVEGADQEYTNTYGVQSSGNMLWLDSTYPVDSTDPGAARGTCSTDSGVPADVEKEQADSSVIFSDIRFGPIGSTTEGTVSV